ncbi:hypothetical protein OSB04_025949 [Centaurea solstitialis]|uniref:F-box protein n=1 Tax=Centaurea solstitialis TaxID=347529 RepID=A0AA38W4F8_9ASTR|nr:hypothetical protein OSB04_025949 [Centaurea solstitialis]
MSSSCSVENQNPNNNSTCSSSSSLNFWLKKKKALVFSTIRRRSSFYKKPPNSPNSPLPSTTLNETKSSPDDYDYDFIPQESKSSNEGQINLDADDETLLQILSRVPQTESKKSTSLVSRSWLNLQGRLVRSVRVLEWSFLTSGRMFLRFPNLVDVDLLHATLRNPKTPLFATALISFGHEFGPPFCGLDSDIFSQNQVKLLPVDQVDSGLKALATTYPNLQRLVVANCSEIGLLNVAEGCRTLQELVLHRCHDEVLRGIAAFTNLQILKLIGSVDGLYSSLVSDIGLTILAQGCKRLVKLELRGCEGSYDGLRAIGQCCHMLEELALCDHRMDDGWLSALSYCQNLKILSLVSCKRIDQNPGLDEHLGCCRMLERLHLERCHLKEKQQSLRALFLVCQAVRELVVKNCWGLKDGVFLNANLCRWRVKLVSLEGCSKLTTQGLEAVVVSFKELESLRVISCNNIKEDEVSPALSNLFATLKNLKWTPDNRSLVLTSLSESGMGKRGGRFFKKLQILNT